MVRAGKDPATSYLAAATCGQLPVRGQLRAGFLGDSMTQAYLALQEEYNSVMRRIQRREPGIAKLRARRDVLNRILLQLDLINVK